MVCYADKPIPAAPSFEADVWPVLENRCTASCHENMGLAPHLPDAAGAYANLVGVASPSASLDLVSAGDPEGSYLWHKVAGTHTGVEGGGGGPMPAIGELCVAELQTIYAWILAGAEP